MNICLLGGLGYIGSALDTHLSSKGYETTVVDLAWFWDLKKAPFSVGDYKNLSKKFLSNFDVVILTAAHSSVALCEWDPMGAFTNNSANFVDLLSKLDKQKFIYAGSSCVYRDTGEERAKEEDSDHNFCDNLTLTKTLIDYYAQQSDVEYYGLRFGSVNGASPNFRGDLMINAMTTSAINEGVVRISNRDKYRPILGMQDLVRAVEHVIEAKEDLRGIYNVASFNSTIGEIGFDVLYGIGDLEYSLELRGKLGHIKREYLPDSPTYDFSIHSGKFENAFYWKPRQKVRDIVETILKTEVYKKPTYRATLPGGIKYGQRSD